MRNYDVKHVQGSTTTYTLKGAYHRIDGPAVIYERIIDGEVVLVKLWALNGEILMCKSQQEFEKYLKLKSFW